MTTITTYAELKQNVVDFGKRADAESKIDTFIDLCESQINRDLRVTEMDVSDTGTTSTSVRYVSLPARCLDLRQILITVDGNQYELDSASNINGMSINPQAGVPCRYVITNRIELDRLSDQAYTLTYQFYQGVNPLSSSNTTNDILTNYPEIYLAGTMVQYYLWARQLENSAYWQNMYALKVADANTASMNKRHPSGMSSNIHRGMVV